MAGTEPAESFAARLGRMLLAASALALLAALPALAQESGLRGGLPEGETELAAAADEGAPDAGFRSTYVTRNPETGPEEEASGSIFDDPEPDDPFGDAPLPSARPADPPSARPDTREEVPAEPEAETTGTVRAESVERIEAAEPVNQRAEAIEARDRTPEEDPYSPLGLRLGTFIVRPSLEQGVTWTSNASSSPGGSSAVLSETTLRLNAVSDWSRHSAAIDAYGIFRKSISGEDVSDPEAGIDGDLILDLGGDFRATASARYNLRPESAASPVELPPVTSRPLRQILTGSAGLEKDAGKLRLGLRGAVEQQQFGDADLEGGGTLSQRERDFVLTSAILRAGYEISPALTPFVEGEIGRRAYDLSLDSSGYDRSANRIGLRAGVALDLGEKLSGEFSAGWLREDFDDERLDALSALSVSADLFWSPVRGTNVGLYAATQVEGSTTAGESGSVLYTGRLSVEREMRANLTGNAVLGMDWRDYAADGRNNDLTLSAEAGLTYWLNRYAGLTGRARHETVKSGEPGRDTETNSVFVGVKLQR